MPSLIFTLTTAETGVVPDLEYRDATARTVNSYQLESIADNNDGSLYVYATGLYNTTTGTNRLAVAMAGAEASLARRVIVEPADYAADITTEQTATSGTTSAVTKTGAGWTASALVGKVIVFTGGTNGNANGTVRAVVSANTTDTISFSFGAYDTGFSVACNNTTKFKVFANAYDLTRRGITRAAMANAGKAGTI